MALKAVALSDIHLDINTKRKSSLFLTRLVEYLAQLKGDILIFTGDVAGSTRVLVEFLDQTQDLHFEYKMFVPGNHDVWVNKNAKGLSAVKYYEILPEVVTSYGWEYIPNNPLILDDVAILGTMGWYDYSSRNRIWDSQISISAYEKKKLPSHNLELMDRHFVNFSKSDLTMANQFIQDLKRDLQFVRDRIDLTELSSIITMTHMVPFAEFIDYRGILKYDYFTAFFGNFVLGEFIRNLSDSVKVHSFFGQIHIPRIRKLNPQLIGYCVPIGYPREYGRNATLKDIFSSRIKEIDI